ncbi:MAG TPA: hypothetical protein VM689_06160 [Aliidongia sp.]|nr:hypothetical protein [Aliidongia sp.]
MPGLANAVGGALLDPDSYMRLVRIQVGLQHNSFADLVPNDASGDGTLLHWSHLLDGILLALSAPLAPFLGWERALRWIGLGIGPVGVGCLGTAIAWSIRPWADQRWLWLAPAIAFLSPAIAGYGAVGVIHHHIPAAITIVLSLGWVARAIPGNPAAGWHAGFWAALGIWLTPETMPFGVAGFATLVLAWLQAPHRAELGLAIRRCGTAYLIMLALALLIDPPYSGYGAVEIDRLSIVFLALGLVAFASGQILAAVGRSTLPAAYCILLGGGSALALFGIWVALFPAVIRGPAGLLTPEETEALFGAIVEMEPITKIDSMLSYLACGTLAAIFALHQFLQRREPIWGWIALCSAGLVGLGLAHIRFSTYSEIIGAAALPLILARWDESGARYPERARALVRVGLVSLFILLPILPRYFPSDQADADAGKAETACQLTNAGPWLAPYAGAVIMSQPTNAPELLYRTQVKTVSSLFHRGIAAYMRERAAWRSTAAETVPDAVRETRAQYILYCTGQKRNALVRGLPKTTLMDQFADGHIPPWLQVESRLAGTDMVLYRIDPSS